MIIWKKKKNLIISFFCTDLGRMFNRRDLAKSKFLITRQWVIIILLNFSIFRTFYLAYNRFKPLLIQQEMLWSLYFLEFYIYWINSHTMTMFTFYTKTFIMSKILNGFCFLFDHCFILNWQRTSLTDAKLKKIWFLQWLYKMQSFTVY